MPPILPVRPLPIGQRSIRVGARAVREEPGEFHHTFVIPNEHNNHLAARSVAAPLRGAVISVGTFRALNNSLLTRGKTYLLDVDKHVVDFNERLIEVLRVARDRHEALAMVLGKDAGALVRARRQDVSSDPMRHFVADRAFLHALRSAPKQVERLPRAARHFHELNDRLKVWAPHREEALPNAFDKYAHSPDRWRATIFGSDAAFRAVQRKIALGQVVVLSGSVSGDVTLPGLATALRGSREKVSLVDLSNVPEYLTSHEELKALARNLRGLPLDPDAKVFHTVNSAEGRFTGGDHWEHRALPARQMAERLHQALRVRERAPFNSLEARIPVRFRDLTTDGKLPL